ncbi:hypothetical protein K491DRAFT_694379 [Lophiostoma macrostomum CBS 122681]|uniref:Uncharacterized protein n=1 Tax=Lophiostoma macrostomum CBS 122681 TaxID=1314788 RepID=A0A6A6T3E7_9PLEO|nr:hypothetical protein K491DRAFT_694379 [Lophiostoma macrostomum CBS 122681]
MPSMEYHVVPVRYNSQCITFPEWISIFTICLAPLIAHIASGAPPISYLAQSPRPKWYDLICHYNPTSILWRYAVITDRRIRARDWNRDDLGASNAIFWTSKGWKGGEEMSVVAAPYCSRCPEDTHTQLNSVAMLKTVITTLQGGAAAYSLIGSLLGLTNVGFITLMGLDMIFYPLAILGLLRLCAAAWLTEDFAYGMLHEFGDRTPMRDFQVPKLDEVTIPGTDSSGGPLLVAPPTRLNLRFTPPGSSWSSRIFRSGFLLLCGAIWFLALIFMAPGVVNGWRGEVFFTATSLVVAIFYLYFFTITLVLLAWYFIRGETTSTIIPCISQAWYRIYTLVVMGLTVVMIIFACIETNKGPNGLYTSVRLPLKTRCYDWRQQ